MSEPEPERGLQGYFDGAFADPYPLYRRLLAGKPVVRHSDTTYLVTHHAAVKAVYRDAERFIQPRTRVIHAGEPRAELPPESVRLHQEIVGFQQLMISRKNGAVHRRYRTAANRGFVPRRMEEVRSMIEEIVDDLLAPLAGQKSADLMEFAYRVPLLVIMEILGAAREDADKVKRWGDAFLDFAISSPDDIEHVRAGHEQLQEYREYARELISRNRRSESQTNLVSLLLDAEVGDRLEHEELVATFMHLLLAGHETTTNLIGNGLALLLTHRDQWAQLRDNPALVAGAVDEVLRFEAPVQVIVKGTAEDTTLHGLDVPAGSSVVLCQGSANRDPAVFDDPDRFDITREPNDHLAFGYGSHFCLGAPLARLEGQIAFAAIAKRFPDLALAADADHLEWFGLPHFRALKKLPVTLTAQRAAADAVAG
jgi:cytochrome P450